MVQHSSSPETAALPLDHLALRGKEEAPALVLREGTLSYKALTERVGAMAAWLQGQAEKGARIATWAAKGELTCLMPLAAARAGMVHVPINPLLKRAQVAHILADSGASLLIATPARLSTLEEGDAPCPALGEGEAMAETRGFAPLGASKADPQELAAILYTSGSTGRPKGVMLSHANMWLGAVAVADYLHLTSEDRVLGVLPFSFDYGQNQMLSTWAAGGCVVPLDYLTPRDVVKAIAAERITTLAGVPPLWVQLVEAEWPEGAAATLRRITNSGGALGKALVMQLRDTFPQAALYPMYGLTEAFRSTYLPPDLVATHPESMGRAIPHAEILVCRPDGSITDDGEAGELVHCGPLVAQGYWNDPVRTAERFRPAPPASHYGGMAVWSGDTVKRDADGLLTFVGRDDAMIKSAGNRISPTEIEEAANNVAGVAESVAFGVPDDRLGQAICLLVRASAQAPDTLDHDIRMQLRRDMPNFMQPRDIIFLSAFPRTANGKIDRIMLMRDHGAMANGSQKVTS